MSDAAPTDNAVESTYRIEDDPDNPTHDQIFPADFTLVDLLDFTFGVGDEADDRETGLTIVLQGVVVTGTVISRKAWVAAATELGGSQEGTISHALRTRWEDDTARADEVRQRRRAAELPDLTRRFVHFKDASILPAGANARINAPLFRARLTEVGGWALGRGEFNDE